MPPIRIIFQVTFVDGVLQASANPPPTVAAMFPGIQQFTDALNADRNAFITRIQEYVPELNDLWVFGVAGTEFAGVLEFTEQSHIGQIILSYKTNDAQDIWPFGGGTMGWTIVRILTDRIFSLPAQVNGDEAWPSIRGLYELRTDHEDEITDGGGIGSGGNSGVK